MEDWQSDITFCQVILSYLLSPTMEVWSELSYFVRSFELLVITYHGSLTSYLINRDEGFQLQHSFYFNQQYPLGISTVTYHSLNKVLLVGGCGRELSSSKSQQEGLTAWRILSGAPFYKLITDLEEDMRQVRCCTLTLTLFTCIDTL